MLRQLDTAGRDFGLCLYNAGMDLYEGCDVGGLEGITLDVLAARERLVFDLCGRRRLAVAFVLAGGYLGARLDRSRLVELHRTTLLAASRDGRGGVYTTRRPASARPGDGGGE